MSPANKRHFSIGRDVTSFHKTKAPDMRSADGLLLAGRPARKMPEPHRTWLYRYLPRTSPFDV
ncbi:hypothetical protein NECAME_13399, partial [Necator americanus]